MKKSLLLFALVLLLAGCASTGNQAAPAGGTPAVSPSEEPGLTAGAPEKMTCRIVDGAEEGELVLAGPGGAGDVYTLDTEGLAVDGTLADGAMVEVGFDGMILETYPAKFGHVTGVTVLEEPADDRCGLYLQVLSDLWEVDTALNTGLEELVVEGYPTNSALAHLIMHDPEFVRGQYDTGFLEQNLEKLLELARTCDRLTAGGGD